MVLGEALEKKIGNEGEKEMETLYGDTQLGFGV